MLLKEIRFLVSQNEEREILENVSLRIEENKIKGISDSLEPESDEKVIDCSGKIVLPGLINAHTHVSMSLLRGIEDNEILDKWLFEHVMPAEHKMKGEHVRKGAELGIVEMLKSGTTCFNDMYAPEKEVAEAAKQLGIRAAMGDGYSDNEQDTGDQLDDSREFISDFIDEKNINPVVNPHAVYTCSTEALEGAIEQSKEFDIPIHIHISETTDENEDSIEKRDMTPMQYLKKIGMLDRKVIAAHCTHLNEEDMQIMRKKDVGVVHCPSANLKLGSGVAPVPEMFEKDITVGLGTDGPASNNSLNMFQEMKTASLIQKEIDPRKMNAQKVLDMATINGAEILGIEGVGRIEKGWKADLIAVRIDESMRPARKENIVSHLVFSNPEVSETIVDGNLVVEDGKLDSNVDLERIEDLSKELW